MVAMPWNPTKPNPIYLIYMYKEDLVLNNLQWLICHYKSQPIKVIPMKENYLFKLECFLIGLSSSQFIYTFLFFFFQILEWFWLCVDLFRWSSSCLSSLCIQLDGLKRLEIFTFFLSFSNWYWTFLADLEIYFLFMSSCCKTQ